MVTVCLFVRASVQYEDTQSQLLDLRQRYERTEKEKLNIHQELEQCRSSLKLLQDKTSSVSTHTHAHTHTHTLKPKTISGVCVVTFVVVVCFIFSCCLLDVSSHSLGV